MKMDLVLWHRCDTADGLADKCTPGAGSDGEPASLGIEQITCPTTRAASIAAGISSVLP